MSGFVEAEAQAEAPPAACDPSAAARAARLEKFRREQLIVDYLNRGVSVAEIAARLGVGEKRMRAVISEIVARRQPHPPEEFVAIQVGRLNEALLVAYSAMSETNLGAVDRVVKIVRELDRYHGVVAAGRRAAPEPQRLEAPAGALTFGAALVCRARFAPEGAEARDDCLVGEWGGPTIGLPFPEPAARPGDRGRGHDGAPDSAESDGRGPQGGERPEPPGLASAPASASQGATPGSRSPDGQGDPGAATAVQRPLNPHASLAMTAFLGPDPGTKRPENRLQGLESPQSAPGTAPQDADRVAEARPGVVAEPPTETVGPAPDPSAPGNEGEVSALPSPGGGAGPEFSAQDSENTRFAPETAGPREGPFADPSPGARSIGTGLAKLRALLGLETFASAALVTGGIARTTPVPSPTGARRAASG